MSSVWIRKTCTRLASNIGRVVTLNSTVTSPTYLSRMLFSTPSSSDNTSGSDMDLENNEGGKEKLVYWQEKMHAVETKVKYGDKSHSAGDAYHEMGIEYDTVAKEWGYISNELAVNLLLQHTDNLEKYRKDANGNDREVKILDAGCGTGFVAQYLSDQLAGLGIKAKLDIAGIDVAQGMLDGANTKNIYHRLFVQNLDETPYSMFESNENNTFDVIISAGVLPYCTHFKEILNEWLRLCTNGGIIVTSLRTDMTHLAIEKFEEIEQQQPPVVKRVKLTEPVVHIGGNDTYASDLQAQYYIATKI